MIINTATKIKFGENLLKNPFSSLFLIFGAQKGPTKASRRLAKNNNFQTP